MRFLVALFLFVSLHSSAQKSNIIQLDIFWGNLKYNSVSKKGEFVDWDKYYLALYPKVLEAKDQKSLNEIFEEFIICIDNKGWKKSKAENESILDDSKYMGALSVGLKKYLAYTGQLYAEKREEMNAPQSFCTDGVYFPCFRNEPSYHIDSCKQEKFRGLALAKFWNAINYFYPYKSEIGNDWYNVLENYTKRFQNVTDPDKYLILCRELNTEVLDAHAATSIQGAYAKQNPNTLPFKAMLKDGVLHVQKAYTKKLVKGDQILKIEGVEITEFLSQKRKLFKVKNGVCDHSILQKMLYTAEISTSVVAKRGEQLLSLELDNIPIRETFKFKECPESLAMTDSTIYVNASCYTSQQLVELLEKAPDGKKLTIDLRYYPAFKMDVLSHFTKEKITYGQILLPKRNFPGQFKKYNDASIQPKSPDFSGKFSQVEVLIDNETISKGEYMALGFKALDAKLIGQRTSGTMGSMTFLELPGKYIAVFTTTGFKTVEGKSLYNTGVQPDKILDLDASSNYKYE